ncbi:hypothetical protein BVG19_g1741 [[Candida] boidinii]|nr:hypothetical protein BVG19_g1741 [[Candida] boidinii]OWB50054.1 hypothetical protein B5S27_g1600 [[Candida] boidinii]
MPLVPRPKHQNIILKCYPGKSSDIKPNNAELSYLLYYASTRRTKLEKVGKFLEKKTRSDFSRSRTGHISVTLNILLDLMNKCNDDLGIFANNIINILLIALETKDLSICQLASKNFNSFCEFSENKSLFTSNSELSSLFKKLANTFIQFGINSVIVNKNNGIRSTNNNEKQTSKDDWLVLSLYSIRPIANYIDPNFASPLIESSLEVILNTISSTNSTSKTEHILEKLKTNLSENEQKSVTGDHDETFGDSNLSVTAVKTLKCFFDTSSRIRIDRATVAICKYIINNSQNNWYGKLIELCTNRTHIELRYLIVNSLINELKKLNATSAKILISNQITALLSSSVNMIGLPVKDIEYDVLSLQQTMVKSSVNPELNENYLQLIKSLGKHIYYNDQITDLIKFIIHTYHNNFTAMRDDLPSSTPLTSKQFKDLTVIFIDNISNLLDISKNDRINSFKVSPLPTNIFNHLLSIINFNSNQVNSADKLFIQESWLIFIDNYLKNEVVKSSKKLSPNYHSFITNRFDNPLVVYFKSIDELIKSHKESIDNQDSVLQKSIIQIVDSLFDIFGINAFLNCYPKISSWISEGDIDSCLLIKNLSAFFIYKISIITDNNPLKSYAISKISALKNSSQYLNNFNISDELSSSVQLSDDSNINLEELDSLLSNDPSMKKWLIFIKDSMNNSNNNGNNHNTTLNSIELSSSSNRLISNYFTINSNQNSLINLNLDSSNILNHSHSISNINGHHVTNNNIANGNNIIIVNGDTNGDHDTSLSGYGNAASGPLIDSNTSYLTTSYGLFSPPFRSPPTNASISQSESRSIYSFSGINSLNARSFNSRTSNSPNVSDLRRVITSGGNISDINKSPVKQRNISGLHSVKSINQLSATAANGGNGARVITGLNNTNSFFATSNIANTTSSTITPSLAATGETINGTSKPTTSNLALCVSNLDLSDDEDPNSSSLGSQSGRLVVV